MIRQVVMYQVACDGCGIAHDGPDGIVAWSDENGALEMATGSEWESRADGTLHRCPQCQEIEEDGDDG